MYKIILIALVFGLNLSIAQGQLIPQNPNLSDQSGKKQGKWTILYDQDWYETSDEKLAEFYRILSYKDDQIIGKVIDYYKSGIPQMIADSLISENPAKYHGQVTYYRPDGSKENVRVWQNGKIIADTAFTIQGEIIEKDWQTFTDEGQKALDEGNLQKALQIYIEAKHQAEREFGKAHINYITSCHSVSTLYFKSGDHDNAKVIWEEMKPLQEKILGKENEDYINTCLNLGYVYTWQGYYDQAKSNLLEAKDLTEKIAGKDHETYVDATSAIAYLYKNIGEYDQAKALFLEIKDIEERMHGKESLRYSFTLTNLANLYQTRGKSSEVEALYLEVKKIQEKTVGKNNEYYASTCNNLVIFYIKQTAYKKALPLALEAIHILEEVPNALKTTLATSFNNLGTIYEHQSQYQKAEQFYIKAKENVIEEIGKNNNRYTAYVNNLGHLYYLQGRFKEAEKLFLEVKTIREKTTGTNTLQYATTLDNLGALYESVSEFKKAEAFYLKSLKLRKELLGTNNSIYSNSLNNLATLYINLDQYAEAEKLLKEAREINLALNGEEHLDYIINRMNLAGLYRKKGEYQKSQAICIHTKKILEKKFGKKHGNYAYVCHNLGRLYKDMGNYPEAERLLIEALGIVDTLHGENNPTFARYAQDLASTYHSQGKYVEAETWHLKSKSITVALFGEKSKEYASNCNNLSTLYENMGLYKQAEALLLESREIISTIFGKHHSQFANSSNNLAALYDSQKKYNKAIALFAEAKSIWETKFGKESKEYALSCSNLAYVYKKIKRYQEAEALLLESLQIRKKIFGEKHTEYGAACQNLGSLYTNLGRYQEAEALLFEARSIFAGSFSKRHVYYTISSNSLGDLYLEQNKISKAEPYYQEVLQNNLVQCQALLPTLSDNQREDYMQSIRAFFDEYTNFAIQTYTQNPEIIADLLNLQLSIKGLVFQSFQKMQNQILESNDPALIERYKSWKAQKTYLAKAIQLSKKEQVKKGIDIDSLNQATNQLERELSQHSELFALNTSNKTYTWKDIQHRLKPGEGLVEIIRVLRRKPKTEQKDTVYTALIITPNTRNHPDIVVFENGHQMENRQLKVYRNKILYKSLNKYSYETYLKPIHQKLQTEGIKKIFLSADGVYHQINVLTLFNPNSEKYLIEELDIQLLSSPKDLIDFTKNSSQLDVNHKNLEVHLFGNPQYDQYPDNQMAIADEEHRSLSGYLMSSFDQKEQKSRFLTDRGNVARLPGTKEEVENIQKICKAEKISPILYTELNASEENIKKLDNPDILHIATHGYFLENLPKDQSRKGTLMHLEYDKYVDNPLLRCGLLFAGAEKSMEGEKGRREEDGMLTAQEALSLYLDETNLVVLSACETGLGEISNGEGVYGLQRAFRQAGAKTVLMSLWTVGDEATRDLMISFYQNLLQKKQSKQEAFFNAQMSLKAKYPEPYFWGAFVMVGE